MTCEASVSFNRIIILISIIANLPTKGGFVDQLRENPDVKLILFGDLKQVVHAQTP